MGSSCARHPADTFRHQYIRALGWHQGIICSALDINNAGENRGIDIKQARSVFSAKMPPAMARCTVDLQRAFCDLDRAFFIHGSIGHRRARVLSAILAMTQRVCERFAFNVLPSGTAMTTTSNGHLNSFYSTKSSQAV